MLSHELERLDIAALRELDEDLNHVLGVGVDERLDPSPGLGGAIDPGVVPPRVVAGLEGAAARVECCPLLRVSGFFEGRSIAACPQPDVLVSA